MRRFGIGMVATGLIIALSVFCSEGFAESQVEALIEAAKKGDVEHVRDLLDKGADINAKDTCGGTPLMGASGKGNTEIVKMLLAKGADTNAKDCSGVTALMFASLKGHAEVVKVLLVKAADINAKDTCGWTALMLASANSHAEVVKVLLGEGADVNAKNKNGSTALQMASLRNHPEVIKLLKAHGAEETYKSKSPSNADIWGIAVLLCISCALFVSGMVAWVREKSYGLTFAIFSMAMAAWCGAVILTRGNVPFVGALLCCPPLFLVISRLTGIAMSRRQVSPPCIWVRPSVPGQSPIRSIIVPVMLITFLVCVTVAGFSGPVDRMELLVTLWQLLLFIAYCWPFFPRFQICGNGLWQESTLQPWDEFRSFSWTGETKDGLGLRLDPRNVVLAVKRLLVRPQDREAVQQLLEAKLPERSSGAEEQIARRGSKWKGWSLQDY